MAGKVGCTGAVGPRPAAARLRDVRSRGGRILRTAGARERARAPHAQPGARCLHLVMHARRHVCLHAAASAGAAASAIRAIGACGMRVRCSAMHGAAALCPACSGSRQHSSAHAVMLSMLVPAHNQHTTVSSASGVMYIVACSPVLVMCTSGTAPRCPGRQRARKSMGLQRGPAAALRDGRAAAAALAAPAAEDHSGTPFPRHRTLAKHQVGCVHVLQWITLTCAGAHSGCAAHVPRHANARGGCAV